MTFAAATLSRMRPERLRDGASGRTNSRGTPHWRLGSVLLATFGAAAATLIGILQSTQQQLAREFSTFVLLALGAVALAAFCRLRRHNWRMSDSALIVALITISLLLCGLVATSGLRLRFPIADGWLGAADAALGFDVGQAVRFTASRPRLSDLLHFSYNWAPLGCAGVVLLNLANGNRRRCWHLVVTLVVAMQLTAMISVLAPAKGAILSLGLDSLQGYGLPFGAGTYAGAAFDHFYHGPVALIELRHMTGVVVFPSYHTVLALVMVQGLADSLARWPAVLWGAVSIVSTIPMGGHYMVDVAGGTLVWAAACLLAGYGCSSLASYSARPVSAVRQAQGLRRRLPFAAGTTAVEAGAR